MVWWMKYQIWTPILLLQFLNIFWYFLILRVAYRYVYLSSLRSHSPYFYVLMPTGPLRWGLSQR